MGVLLIFAWCAAGYFCFTRRSARKELARMKKARDFEMLPVQGPDVVDEEEAVDGGADNHLLALPPPELDN